MKVEMKPLPRGQAEFIIEITPAEYDPFLKKAAQMISENIKTPGFRQGKASFEIIVKQVGETKVWEEALEGAVRKTLFDALKEKSIDTVGSPKIEVQKLAPNNPVIFKATVNLLPKIESLSYEDITVRKNAISIDNTKIEKQLHELQKMRGKEILVSREAKKGDKVEIDFSLSIDNVSLDGGDAKKFPLYLGENKFIPGFEENVIGQKAGETKEFKLTFPKNYHQEIVAGKLTDCKVKVSGVYEIQLPELSDALAQDLKFKDLNDLKDHLKKTLEKEAKSAEERRLEDEIIDKLLDKNRFSDICDVLINSESKTMLAEIEQSVAGQGVSFDEYLSHMKKTKDEMLMELAPSATKRIKGAILFREIAKNASISASEDEITQSIQSLKEQYAHDENAKKTLDSPDYRHYMSHTLTSQKVLQFLKEKIIK
ncbi:MAG: Trigger factor [Parcubacteria group bacterium GW2011_GWA2_38_13]|nr:MAG: Trigger factor [Parcubacteria group bacterium GW2011_GWA2_38_13]